jgi:hypothetical protein
MHATESHLSIKCTVFRCATPYSFVGIHEGFGDVFFLLLGYKPANESGRFLRNFGNYLPNYTTLYHGPYSTARCLSQLSLFLRKHLGFKVVMNAVC